MTHHSFWPSHRRGWLYLGLTLSAIAMAATFGIWSPKELSQRARASGTSAPDFRAMTTAHQIVRLSAYRGQPILLNFFSTTCSVSAEAVANLDALQRARPDLVVLSINTNRASEAEIKVWGEQHDANYPLVPDPGRQITALYRPYATPFWVFIRPDGVIAGVRIGEHRAHNLLFRVNELLPVDDDWWTVGIFQATTNSPLPTLH